MYCVAMMQCIVLLCPMQRLDRAWYDNDGAYDDTNNPFANVSEEYVKKKEEQLQKNTVKKMSAQQRQINKVCPLTLLSRCLRSHMIVRL